MHSAQCWRGPCARPTATRGAAQLGLGRRGPAWPRPARRAAHGSATRGGAARRAGDDMAPMRGKRLRSSGAPVRERWTTARRRRASSGQDGSAREAIGTRAARGGDGRGDGGAREAVGTAAARARWSGRSGVGEVTAAAQGAGRLSGGRGAVEAAVGTRGAQSR
jgi:hypothetical protein